MILYAILCGSLPFDDENIRNLFRKIKGELAFAFRRSHGALRSRCGCRCCAGGIYSIPSYVSQGARDLMQRMLIVDPLKRISMGDIRWALCPFCCPVACVTCL